MPLTLDSTTALIVVDVQKGILRMLPDDAAARLVAANNQLVDVFHDAGLPVVWIAATGLPAGRVANPIPEDAQLPADFSQIHDDMHVGEGDLSIEKQRTWSAFPRTGLAEKLRERGVTTVVISGIATGAGVESTARSAYDEGFTVVVAGDACLDGNQQRHQLSLEQAVPGFGFSSSIEEVAAALAQR